MNLSDAPFEDVPPGVVTVMSLEPTVPTGEVAVTVLGESAVMVAAVVPKVTPVAAERFVPVMVTDVPPPVGPLDGLTPVTVGEPRTIAALIEGVMPNDATTTGRANASVALALNHWVE